MAITTVIEPALLYPLVTFTFSTKDFQPIDSITSQMKCVSLGLNRHFPRAVLHGPMLLGGLGYPLSSQKNARDRLNYFFYDIRSHSTLSIKFEMSIIYSNRMWLIHAVLLGFIPHIWPSRLPIFLCPVVARIRTPRYYFTSS